MRRIGGFLSEVGFYLEFTGFVIEVNLAGNYTH